MEYAKGEYLRTLLTGIKGNPTLIDAALIFWHSQIPMIEAKVYIKNLADKLTQNRVSYMKEQPRGKSNGTRYFN